MAVSEVYRTPLNKITTLIECLKRRILKTLLEVEDYKWQWLHTIQIHCDNIQCDVVKI